MSFRLILALLIVVGASPLTSRGDSPQRTRRVLYNFDGDSCLSTKAGGKGPVLRDLGPLQVGLRKQLFVDDYIVTEKRNLTRTLGQVRKANHGKPIFTDGWFYGTVLHDEGRFKLWFRKPGTNGFGYAESTDGLSFTKRADVRGINFAGDYTLAVEIDPAETDPLHRFKAGYDAPGMAAGIAHSADGITWTPYHDGKPVTAVQILWTGVKLMRQSFRGLMDESDPEADRVLRAVLAAWSTASGGQYHRLRHRSAGDVLWVEVHLLFRGDQDLRTVHAAATVVEGQIERSFPQHRVMVTTHLEPLELHADHHPPDEQQGPARP